MWRVHLDRSCSVSDDNVKIVIMSASHGGNYWKIKGLFSLENKHVGWAIDGYKFNVSPNFIFPRVEGDGE